MTRERKARKIPPYNELNDEMREQMEQFDRNRGLRDITLTSTYTLQLDRRPAATGVPRPQRFEARPHSASGSSQDSSSSTIFWMIIAAVAGFIGHDYITRRHPPQSAPRLQAVSPSDLRQLTPAKDR